MFRAVLVTQSSRGGFFKRSTESQSYEQNSCHVDGLKGDLPSGFSIHAEQLVGWSGKQLLLPSGRALVEVLVLF